MASLFVFCVECGGSIPDEAKFCPSCGSKISPPEEKNSSQQDQLQIEIEELKKVVITGQENNFNTRNIVLIGIGFFCLFLIFKPGPLGFSMIDLAQVECDYWYDEDIRDCEDERSGKIAQVLLLIIISVFSFIIAARKPATEVKEESEFSLKFVDDSQEKRDGESKHPNSKEFSSMNLIRIIVLIICILLFSSIANFSL